MATPTEPRFELTRVSPVELLLVDHRRAPHDPWYTIARIYQVEIDEVEVDWLQDFALPSRYSTAQAVLDDIHRTTAESRSTRPNPIPHLPPRRTGTFRGGRRSAP